jgi:hypothetical protein
MIGRARSQPDLTGVNQPPPPSSPPPNRPPPPVPDRLEQMIPNLPPVPPIPRQPDLMAPVRDAVAKHKPMFDSAERIIAVNPVPTALQAFAQTYQTASGNLTQALQGTDPNHGTTALNTKIDAANRIMLVNGRIQAVNHRRAQIQKQQQQFDEFSAISQDVKRTMLRPGGADNIEKEKLKGGALFQTYIDKMREAEQARANIDPRAITDENTARDIKAKCEAMMAAAQAYIAHFNSDYSDRQKKDKTNLRKKQLCEEGLLTARQFALAMEMDSLGRPDQANPWNEEKEQRAGSVRAAVYFESGYQQARTLKSDAEGGQSESYWLKSSEAKEGFDQKGRGTVTMQANKREAIFKPAKGERVVDIMPHEKPGSGAIKEMLAGALGGLFASQTGIDLQVPETTLTSITPNALQGEDPNGPPIVGSMQKHAGVSKAVEDQSAGFLDKVKPKEARKIAIFDVMMMNCDRHGGNILFDDTDPDNPRLVPIDNAASMPQREDFKSSRGKFAGITDSMFGGVSVQNKTLGMQAAYEPFDPETIAQLQLLDPSAVSASLKRQRDSAGQLNPGFQAQDLVPDECIDLTERRMMFLKRAAKSLSPAEVQLAITVHGERLFDATNDDFNDVADDIIAQMMPMRDAYKEIFLAPPDQLANVVKTLTDNGWAEVPGSGYQSAVSFIMKDPVSALKLFKSKQVNPNPVVLDQPETQPLPADAPVPNQQQKAAIKAAFGFADNALANTTEQNLKQMLVNLNAFNALGGRAEYDRAIAALGAKPDDPSSRTMLETLGYWDKIKALAPDPTGLPRYSDFGLSAAKAAYADLLNRDAMASMKNSADNVDIDQATEASARDQIAEARRVAAMLTDATMRQGFEGQIDQADAKLTNGDAKGAEKDVYALLRDLTNAALDQAYTEARQIKARMAEMTIPEGRAQTDLAMDFENVLKSTRLAACYDGLQIVRNKEQQFAARQTPAVGLPAFTWNQDDASAVKSQATRAKLISKKDTGMTAALAQINKARAKIGDPTNDLPANNAAPQAAAQHLRATRKMLQEGIEAYNVFSIFVNGKLRGLSKEKEWLRYCDSAQNTVAQEIQALEGRLGTINAALPQGETTTVPPNPPPRPTTAPPQRPV